MKILKLIAAVVLFVVVSGLLLFIFFGFTQKPVQRETFEQPVDESVLESIGKPLREMEQTGYGINARPQAATLIDGFPCAAGTVSSTLSGRLYKCEIAEDAVIQGNLIPQNTWVQLDTDSSIFYYFQKDTNIQGVPVIGGTVGLVRPLSVPVGVYPSGRLMTFFSSSNVMIQDVPCRKTKFGLLSGTRLSTYPVINLYENGNLRRCTLSRDTEIGGRSILAGSDIEISEDGELTILDDSWQRRTRLWAAGIFGN